MRRLKETNLNTQRGMDMEENRNYIYAKDSEKLQLTHDEYLALMEKAEEAKHIQEVKNTVIADLQHFLEGRSVAESETPVESQTEAESPVEVAAEPEIPVESRTETEPQAEPEAEAEPQAEPEAEAALPAEVAAEPQSETPENEETEVEKVSVEFSASESDAPAQATPVNGRADISEVPPIKNEITEHFNKLDESGRLFNVFKQYYTCLNEACGGTVRVTMKDGFCSLWNYDEWEEFAFVDIFEGLLRISIDPRYTDALKSLSLCEAPRLISNRRNVICVQIDDLNNTVLEVLTRAFSEVGMQVN
jgi:hypothetical protein